MTQSDPDSKERSPHVLVVEDNANLADTLRKGLEEEGYTVDTRTEGRAGWQAASSQDYDLVVLDRRLPEMTGDEICKRMRATGSQVPLLMLAARAAVGERIQGLDLGADDYLTRPFAFAELLARLRALLRRGGSPMPAILKYEDLELDPAGHTVVRSGDNISLSAREFSLLEYLLMNAGRVMSRDEILANVWGDQQSVTSNVVEVYINYLRRKIDREYPLKLIHNVRGVGYVLRKEP